MKAGHRKHVPRKKSKMSFRRTAQKVNRRNVSNMPMRGGYRM